MRKLNKNVLFVKDLKNNLLSVNKICDQGHTCTFNSIECEIRQEILGKLIETTTKTINNVYILNEIRIKNGIWHKHMTIGYGIEEWAI